MGKREGEEGKGGPPNVWSALTPMQSQRLINTEPGE